MPILAGFSLQGELARVHKAFWRLWHAVRLCHQIGRMTSNLLSELLAQTFRSSALLWAQSPSLET